MNLNQIKARIASARSVGADFAESTPTDVQSALMDLASIAEHLVEQRGVAPLLPGSQIASLSMVTRTAAMSYEIRSSWWAPLIISGPGQKLAAWWFARKVRRKYGRYVSSCLQKMEMQSRKI